MLGQYGNLKQVAGAGGGLQGAVIHALRPPAGDQGAEGPVQQRVSTRKIIHALHLCEQRGTDRFDIAVIPTDAVLEAAENRVRFHHDLLRKDPALCTSLTCFSASSVAALRQSSSMALAVDGFAV
jgi:hypothetical protein